MCHCGTSSFATSSSVSWLPLSVVSNPPPAMPPPRGEPHEPTVRLRPKVHHRWPSVCNPRRLSLPPTCTVIARPLWWAPLRPMPQIGIPVTWACSLTTPLLAPLRWSTGIGPRSCWRRWGLESPAPWPRAKRSCGLGHLSRASLRATRGWAQWNSSIFHFSFGLIQIDFKSDSNFKISL
jgi:hypothetical protein